MAVNDMVGSRKGKIEYRLSPRRRTAISTCSPDVAACRAQGGRQGLLFQLVEQDPELLPKIGIRAADAVCDLDAEHPPLFRALRPDETSAEAVLGEVDAFERVDVVGEIYVHDLAEVPVHRAVPALDGLGACPHADVGTHAVGELLGAGLGMGFPIRLPSGTGEAFAADGACVLH